MIDEIIPLQVHLASAKKRILKGRGSIRCRAIAIQKPDVDIIRARKVRCRDIRRGIREHFKHHRRGVIRDASEVHVDSGKLRKAEESREGGVGSELDGEFGASIATSIFDGRVEELHDLCTKLFAGDSADGLRRIVCKIPLVRICEGEELVECRIAKEVGVRDSRVVDFCYVDVVVNLRMSAASS